jgi:hypothetical protein
MRHTCGAGPRTRHPCAYRLASFEPGRKLLAFIRPESRRHDCLHAGQPDIACEHMDICGRRILALGKTARICRLAVIPSVPFLSMSVSTQSGWQSLWASSAPLPLVPLSEAGFAPAIGNQVDQVVSDRLGIGNQTMAVLTLPPPRVSSGWLSEDRSHGLITLRNDSENRAGWL